MAIMIRPRNWFDDFERIMDSDSAHFHSVASDVYETDDDVVVEMSLPGVKPEELNIQITGDTLTISGERKSVEEDKKKEYYQKQIRYGSFAQSVALPTNIKADAADAHFEHGVLKIVIPKAEEAKPKKIEVKVK